MGRLVGRLRNMVTGGAGLDSDIVVPVAVAARPKLARAPEPKPAPMAPVSKPDRSAIPLEDNFTEF